MFWTKYVSVCNEKGLKPYAILKKLNISSGSTQNWKKGASPKSDVLIKISQELDIPMEYFLNDESTMEEYASKNKSNVFTTMFYTVKAIPQRFVSLRRINEINDSLINNISNYTNSSILFLLNDTHVEYQPKGIYNIDNLNDYDTLFDIFEILDCIADSEDYRKIQIQLSRIVFYNLAQKGFSRETIMQYKEIDQRKMAFIYTGEKNTDSTLNYGLNFSDITMLHRITKIDYQYMFTGIDNKID